MKRSNSSYIKSGFDLHRTISEYNTYPTIQPEFANWLKTKKVFCADGNSFFNRSGPRIVDRFV